MSDDEATRDRLFEEAVRTYREHYAMDEAELELRPDRYMSRIVTGAEATVVLMDADGVPLGSVVWIGDVRTFEPPTRITVVDHFQGLRPPKR